MFSSTMRLLLLGSCVAVCTSISVPPRAHMQQKIEKTGKLQTQSDPQSEEVTDSETNQIGALAELLKPKHAPETLSVNVGYLDLPTSLLEEQLDVTHTHHLLMTSNSLARMHRFVVDARNQSRHSGRTLPHVHRRQGFVRIIARWQTEDTAEVDVEIASPATIMAVFAVLYIPVALGWMYYFYSGRPEGVYAKLLPLSLCTTLIGDNFVNKSLAVLMGAPLLITACQAGAMGIFGALLTFVQFMHKPMCNNMLWPLVMWTSVATMFTLYQTVNHFVAQYCSLAERTVFTNLCPVVSLIFEVTVMPANLKATATFRSKMALAMLVIGAITFSVQYSDFSFWGVIFASLMVIAVVPYRLAQRYALSECKMLPIMLLVMYDGFFLAAPSAVAADIEEHGEVSQWRGWITDSSVVTMLVLSLMTFTANHLCALLMLGLSSATALQVYQNLSNFVVVGLGILFFGDNVMSSPLVLIGLLVCLFAGLWYAIEVQPKSPSTSAEDVPAKVVDGHVPSKVVDGPTAASMLNAIKK